MLLFRRLIESAGVAPSLIQQHNVTLFVAEKREMAIIVNPFDKLNDDNALVDDIPAYVPVPGVQFDLLAVLWIRGWHGKAVVAKGHFDACLRIVVRRRMRIMHHAFCIEIQVRAVVTTAFCFVLANKGVGVLLIFEVAEKTEVFGYS